MIKALVAKRKEGVLLTDFDNFQSTETIGKLLYRRNLHWFKMESLIENMPFTVLGLTQKRKILARTFSKQKNKDLNGRYSILNVKDRYLEQFIREML